jgi:hypothetical protein
MKSLPIYLLLAGLGLSIVVTEYTHAINGNFSGLSGFGQRYAANSFITTQPLYFKEIDSHGHIIRPHVQLITTPHDETRKYKQRKQEQQPSEANSSSLTTVKPINSSVEQITPSASDAEEVKPIKQVINPSKTRDDYYDYVNRFKRFALSLNRWFHH